MISHLVDALSQGASFYGKRKSSFYGEDDSMKKLDANVADATEDFQGPSGAGYFVWRENDDGSFQAQTRLKGKSLDRFIKTDDE